MSLWIAILHLLFFHPQSLPLGGIPVSSGGACSGTDNFTGTDGTLLATYNPCWSDVTNPNGYLVSSCQIQSNSVQVTAAFAACGAMYNLSSDVCQIVVGPYSTDTYKLSCCVSAGVDSGTDKTGYCFFLTSGSGGNWTGAQVNKGGGFLSIQSVSFSQASAHTLRIVRSGTTTVTLTLSVDGSTLGTAPTDASSPYGTGKPAILTTTFSSLADSTLDSFSAI